MLPPGAATFARDTRTCCCLCLQRPRILRLSSALLLCVWRFIAGTGLRCLVLGVDLVNNVSAPAESGA